MDLICKRASGLEQLAIAMKRRSHEDGDEPTSAVASSQFSVAQLLDTRAAVSESLTRGTVGLEMVARNLNAATHAPTPLGMAFAGLWWVANLPFHDDGAVEVTVAMLAPLLVQSGARSARLESGELEAKEAQAANDMYVAVQSLHGQIPSHLVRARGPVPSRERMQATADTLMEWLEVEKFGDLHTARPTPSSSHTALDWLNIFYDLATRDVQADLAMFMAFNTKSRRVQVHKLTTALCRAPASAQMVLVQQVKVPEAPSTKIAALNLSNTVYKGANPHAARAAKRYKGLTGQSGGVASRLISSTNTTKFSHLPIRAATTFQGVVALLQKLHPATLTCSSVGPLVANLATSKHVMAGKQGSRTKLIIGSLVRKGARAQSGLHSVDERFTRLVACVPSLRAGTRSDISPRPFARPSYHVVDLIRHGVATLLRTRFHGLSVGQDSVELESLGFGHNGGVHSSYGTFHSEVEATRGAASARLHSAGMALVQDALLCGAGSPAEKDQAVADLQAYLTEVGGCVRIVELSPGDHELAHLTGPADSAAAASPLQVVRVALSTLNNCVPTPLTTTPSQGVLIELLRRAGVPVYQPTVPYLTVACGQLQVAHDRIEDCVGSTLGNMGERTLVDGRPLPIHALTAVSNGLKAQSESWPANSAIGGVVRSCIATAKFFAEWASRDATNKVGGVAHQAYPVSPGSPSTSVRNAAVVQSHMNSIQRSIYKLAMLEPFNQAVHQARVVSGPVAVGATERRASLEWHHDMFLTQGVKGMRGVTHQQGKLAVALGAISAGEERSRGAIPKDQKWRDAVVQLQEALSIEHFEMGEIEPANLHAAVRRSGPQARSTVLSAHGVRSAAKARSPAKPGKNISHAPHTMLCIWDEWAVQLNYRPLAPLTAKNILMSLRKSMHTALDINRALHEVDVNRVSAGAAQAHAKTPVEEHGPLRFILKCANNLDLFKSTGLLQAMARLKGDIHALLAEFKWPITRVDRPDAVALVEKDLLAWWDRTSLVTFEHPVGATGTRLRVENAPWADLSRGEGDQTCVRELPRAALWIEYGSLPSLLALTEEVLLTWWVDGFKTEAPLPAIHPYSMHRESARRAQQPTNGVPLTTCGDFDQNCETMLALAMYAPKALPRPTTSQLVGGTRPAATAGAQAASDDDDEVIVIAGDMIDLPVTAEEMGMVSL